MEKYIKNHQQHKKNQLYFGSDSEISKIFQKKYPSYLKNKDITLDIKGDIVSIKRFRFKKTITSIFLWGLQNKRMCFDKEYSSYKKYR